MSILRFRVTFEDYDDVHRDIDFEATHTFADLFTELLAAVGFDNKHNGEFFLADHNWRKGKSIGSVSGKNLSALKKVELVYHIDDPHQKFLFEYDETAKWSFQVELIRIISSPEYRATYPKISVTFGLPPVQYKEELIIPVREEKEEDGRGRRSKKPVDNEEDLLLAMLGSMKLDDDDDSETAAAEDEEAVNIEEADLEEEDLETDSEISKLAEEFNNTTEIDESSSSDYGNDDEDEFGSDDYDEDYGGSSGYDED